MKQSGNRSTGARSVVAPRISSALLSIAVLLILLLAEAAAKPAPAASADLRGEAAVAHLQKTGAYDSLAEAVRAARYRVEADATSRRVMNDANGFEVSFAGNGWQLRSVAKDRTWVSNWRLRSFGYGTEQTMAADGGWHSTENRVELRRDSQQITEWFVNTPQGVEHGFTLTSRPGTHKRGAPLRLVMELEGDLTARADEDGQELTLLENSGAEALRYQKLKVWDARGTKLPARMRTEGGGEVWLEVEDAAAVYPITIDPTFVQQQELAPSEPGAAHYQFGAGVAVAGDTAIVGSPGSDYPGTRHGRAYVFVRNGTTWTERQKLTASDSSAADGFGDSIAMSDDTAIITAPYKNDATGAAYIFVRTDTGWTQQQKLTPSDARTEHFFGRSAAISGNTVVVGAYSGSSEIHAGAYIFVRSGTVWTQQQKLTPADGTADGFAVSVAIAGDTVMVGKPGDTSNTRNWDLYARGSVYVFLRSGTTWRERQKLTPSSGGLYSHFGSSLAMSGGTAIIGSSGDTINGKQGQGSAYIFVRAGTAWTEQQKLIASDGYGAGPLGADAFGASVAISGDTAIIGAPYHPVGANESAGAVYVFVREDTVWRQEDKLTPTPAVDFTFGTSVALSADAAIVGARYANPGGNVNQGSAHVFKRVNLRLRIDTPGGASYEVGDEFTATVTVTSGSEPVTVTFDDPLIAERPFSGNAADTILTLDEPELPAPFELTPENPTRSFSVPVRVNDLGITQLVSSLSYPNPDGSAATLQASRKVAAPPMKVALAVTPKQTVFNQTDASLKSGPCREHEANSPIEIDPDTGEPVRTINNCIELTAKVKNNSARKIERVKIPNGEDPLRLISSLDHKSPGVPLKLIEYHPPRFETDPKDPKRKIALPVDLAPGEEATWTWQLNAFDAPASLELEVHVSGVLAGAEVTTYAQKQFKILRDVLLKWGMRPTDGRTEYQSGHNVRADGYIENLSKDKGEEKLLRVLVYQMPEENLGGGFVFPSSYNGPAPGQYEFFDLPPDGDGKRRELRSVFRTFKTEKASTGIARLGFVSGSWKTMGRSRPRRKMLSWTATTWMNSRSR
jgi:hypothetical protein